eukprot:m.99761 g.99761  ORF g.99761 m.99761 type:complete len:341 (-) comp9032_c0_seq18:681-1703(-)
MMVVGGVGCVLRRICSTQRCVVVVTRNVHVSTAMCNGNSLEVFDRNAKRMQRNRAMLQDDFRQYELLKDEMAYRVMDRLEDFSRTFKVGLDIGCGRGYLGKHIDSDVVETLVQADMSQGMLDHFDDDARDLEHRVCLDEEQRLPFEDNTFDIVMSSLSLHWVNDLPGTLKEIKRVLKPDAPFIATMFGGDTLHELRSSLLLAEDERKGGMSTRVSPFTHMSDVGSLLSMGGFTLLTVDMDEIVINFPSMLQLMEDLRGMGESNASIYRVGSIGRETLLAADAIYQELYGNEDGSIPASFQMVHCVGWKPDPSQPKPAARGSATHSLKDISTMLENSANNE